MTECNRRINDTINYCDMVVDLNRRLLDDIERRDEWRKSIDTDLKEISSFIHKIEGPYMAGLWSFRIFVGAILITLAGYLMHYIKRYFA